MQYALIGLLFSSLSFADHHPQRHHGHCVIETLTETITKNHPSLPMPKKANPDNLRHPNKRIKKPAGQLWKVDSKKSNLHSVATSVAGKVFIEAMRSKDLRPERIEFMKIFLKRLEDHPQKGPFNFDGTVSEIVKTIAKEDKLTPGFSFVLNIRKRYLETAGLEQEYAYLEISALKVRNELSSLSDQTFQEREFINRFLEQLKDPSFKILPFDRALITISRKILDEDEIPRSPQFIYKLTEDYIRRKKLLGPKRDKVIESLKEKGFLLRQDEVSLRALQL